MSKSESSVSGAMMIVILALLMMHSAIAWGQPPAPWLSEGMVGSHAPDFSLKTIKGDTVSLSALRGKVVMLNFWFTWCSPCIEELPSMNLLYNKFKANGLVVLAVAMDDSPQPVEDVLRKTPFDFTILLDADRKVSRGKYNVYAQPMTFLIDKNGTIAKFYFGPVNWSTEEGEIKKLLTVEPSYPAGTTNSKTDKIQH
ncbi:MAG: TlpA family protein disulfide reductase [Nitrospirae bacterium]|nr:TlpA family protein disulfide reductase [Nitrospirota bacterium]MBF0592465.1 TlpA family protein disulfide reductase [Nitrospirota bacterium]